MNTSELASIWYNPTKYPQVIQIHTGGKSLTKITIDSGAKREISSEYDNAIQVLNSDRNQVVGGLAPNLVKIGVKDLTKDEVTDIPENQRVFASSFLRMPDSDYLPTKAESKLEKAEKK